MMIPLILVILAKKNFKTINGNSWSKMETININKFIMRFFQKNLIFVWKFSSKKSFEEKKLESIRL